MINLLVPFQEWPRTPFKKGRIVMLKPIEWCEPYWWQSNLKCLFYRFHCHLLSFLRLPLIIIGTQHSFPEICIPSFRFARYSFLYLFQPIFDIAMESRSYTPADIGHIV